MEAVSEILAGDGAHAKPDGGDIATESDIVPVNPCRLVIVIAEVPVALARTVTLVGLAPTVKSCTVYDTETE